MSILAIVGCKSARFNFELDRGRPRYTCGKVSTLHWRISARAWVSASPRCIRTILLLQKFILNLVASMKTSRISLLVQWSHLCLLYKLSVCHRHIAKWHKVDLGWEDVLLPRSLQSTVGEDHCPRWKCKGTWGYPNMATFLAFYPPAGDTFGKYRRLGRA